MDASHMVRTGYVVAAALASEAARNLDASRMVPSGYTAQQNTSRELPPVTSTKRSRLALTLSDVSVLGSFA